MTARHLIIGLDGADLGLVERFGPAVLPNLRSLMERGAYAPLKSVQPPATLPNWTTFLTGVDPGQHGVFDFTTRKGYQVRFSAGTVREAPTIAARLDRLGQRCACLFFPATYPPERLEHGVFISGWDAPVAFEADRSFVSPPAYHDEITRRFGPSRFDDVDEFDTDSAGWHDRLPGALCSRVRRRLEVCEYLLDERPWDMFAVYFGESDTAAHHLWALHDANSPRRPAAVTADQQQGLLKVYQELDRAVGALVERAGGESVEVTIVSDHGFGGASDRVLYLNRALEQAGLLSFARPSIGGKALGRVTRLAKELALTRLPPALRERLFRMWGTSLPSMVESRARFSAIDMARTQVFSDELNYFPALHLNLRGREPEGTVSAEQVQGVIERVREAMLGLRDPSDGAPVVKAVHRRQDLFSGPYLHRAPDLLLDLHMPDGYSYNLMPSAGAPPGGACFRRLSPDEYLGRKGRSLQGSHRERGLFVAAGPAVAPVGQVELEMADATATVLSRMGMPAVPQAAGRAVDLSEKGGRSLGTAPQASVVLDPPKQAFAALPNVAAPSAEEPDDEKVAARLRRLGYIE